MQKYTLHFTLLLLSKVIKTFTQFEFKIENFREAKCMCVFCFPQYLLGCFEVELVDGRKARRVCHLRCCYPKLSTESERCLCNINKYESFKAKDKDFRNSCFVPPWTNKMQVYCNYCKWNLLLKATNSSVTDCIFFVNKKNYGTWHIL